MKKVVKTTLVSEINIDSVYDHHPTGIQANGCKYIAAQTNPGMYQLFSMDNSNGLNRVDSISHGGIKILASYYMSKGYEVFIFSSSREMLEWFIK